VLVLNDVDGEDEHIYTASHRKPISRVFIATHCKNANYLQCLIDRILKRYTASIK
jgi:hypothetical protein